MIILAETFVSAFGLMSDMSAVFAKILESLERLFCTYEEQLAVVCALKGST